MSKLDVYQQLRQNDNYIYKLIQLPPQLQSHLSKLKNNLQLKSTNNGNVLLVTEDKTFKLRQNNQSNTILLMRHENDKLIGYDKCFYQYELNEILGKIINSSDIDIPIYENEKSIQKITKKLTKQQLFNLSPCSKFEFEKLWIEMNYINIENQVFKISNNLITEILYDLITFLISKNKLEEFRKEDIEISYDSNLVNSIFLNFTITTKDNKYKLNDEKIINWFGINELKKLKIEEENQIKLNDFYLNWKSSLPSFYNVSLSITSLRGNYLTKTINKIEFIKYVPLENLSQDPIIKFKQLILIEPIWKYDEILYFFSDFIKSGKKIDSIILKYGKKKKIGSKFIVCSR
ncbi:DCC1 [Candida pseudojiufengensis]|uniref:DCC1 n=1 Tax=Candida pseudojiufengensis TaxID=497109 RepID=UPI002225A638|nr:DCC1 [Candida pseudojiufengensis]KAI5959729.1 DCC1 [Candida pseudojiufengensis]